MQRLKSVSLVRAVRKPDEAQPTSQFNDLGEEPAAGQRSYELAWDGSVVHVVSRKTGARMMIGSANIDAMYPLEAAAVVPTMRAEPPPAPTVTVSGVTAAAKPRSKGAA